jgi:hypothetical protein
VINFKEFLLEKAQPGGAFEDKFYDQISSILKKAGKFNLILNKNTYTVVGIDPPAKEETVKADLTLHLEDGNNLYISLKQFPFPAYAGIAGKGRPYLVALAQHSTVQEYVQRLKKYLASKQLCILSPANVPATVADELKWLKANKTKFNSKGNKPITNDVYCSRGGEEVYWVPKNNPDFTNFIVFGAPEYKEQKDYVDYVIKGRANIVLPFKETSLGLYEPQEELTIIPNGSAIVGDMTPVFFSRTMNGRNAYGILNTRTQIVPLSEAEKRSNPQKI